VCLYITSQTRRLSRPTKNCCTIEQRRHNRDQTAVFVHVCMAHPTIASRRRSGSTSVFCYKTHSLWAAYFSFKWGASLLLPSLRQEARPRVFFPWIGRLRGQFVGRWRNQNNWHDALGQDRACGAFARVLYRRLWLHTKWTRCAWFKLKSTGVAKGRRSILRALGTFDDVLN
jgi:hypothetical protein